MGERGQGQGPGAAQPPRSPVSAAAARPPTAAAPVPGDRATRGRAVREGREQGRGRPGRAAGGGTARAGGGRQQLLPVSGPKMSQPRDSGAPTLLPVRMRTHSSRFRDSTEVPPRAPARPRARALTGQARRLALGARESLTSWRRGAQIGREWRPARPSSRALRARAPPSGACDWRGRARSQAPPTPLTPPGTYQPHRPTETRGGRRSPGPRRPAPSPRDTDPAPLGTAPPLSLESDPRPPHPGPQHPPNRDLRPPGQRPTSASLIPRQ